MILQRYVSAIQTWSEKLLQLENEVQDYVLAKRMESLRFKEKKIVYGTSSYQHLENRLKKLQHLHDLVISTQMKYMYRSDNK